MLSYVDLISVLLTFETPPNLYRISNTPPVTYQFKIFVILMLFSIVFINVLLPEKLILYWYDFSNFFTKIIWIVISTLFAVFQIVGTFCYIGMKIQICFIVSKLIFIMIFIGLSYLMYYTRTCFKLKNWNLFTSFVHIINLILFYVHTMFYICKSQKQTNIGVVTFCPTHSNLSQKIPTLFPNDPNNSNHINTNVQTKSQVTSTNTETVFITPLINVINTCSYSAIIKSNPESFESYLTLIESDYTVILNEFRLITIDCVPIDSDPTKITNDTNLIVRIFALLFYYLLLFLCCANWVCQIVHIDLFLNLIRFVFFFVYFILSLIFLCLMHFNDILILASSY